MKTNFEDAGHSYNGWSAVGSYVSESDYNDNLSMGNGGYKPSYSELIDTLQEMGSGPNSC